MVLKLYEIGPENERGERTQTRNLSKNRTNKMINDYIKKMFSPLVTKEM